jgi:hypothetical protein
MVERNFHPDLPFSPGNFSTDSTNRQEIAAKSKAERLTSDFQALQSVSGCMVCR